MNQFTYTLNCEDLRLSIEFALRRGEFGRIGSSPEVEISLPFVGFSEEECRISLDSEGLLWLLREGSELPIRLDPPSYFHVGSYRFLIRENVEESPFITHSESTLSTPEKANQPTQRRNSRTMLMIVGMLSIMGIGGAAWYIDRQNSRQPVGEERIKTASSSSEEKTKSLEAASVPIHLKNEIQATSDVSKTVQEPALVAQPIGEPPPPTPTLENERMDLEKLAVTVIPCVFLIKVFDGSGNPISTGTGFSVSADGMVVTNHHVIEKGNAFSLVTSQGAKFDNVEVIVSDPDTDLALLRLEAKNLPHLMLAESSKVPIGKRVAVYGSPQGLAGSLSEGIISASERNLSESFSDEKPPNKGVVLQTTTPVSPGSSGSPLFDAEGKVIGVMTLIDQRRNSQSLNFAIPVEALKPLIDRAKSDWSLIKPKPQVATDQPSTASPELEAEPAYRRLRQQMDVKNWVESLKTAKFLTDKYPKSSLLHFLCGICSAQLRLDHQATLSYTKAVELDPSNHFAWNCLGRSLSCQMQLPSALLAFEKAVSLKTDYSSAWDNIVRTNVFLGNWSKATTALNTLAQIDPEMAAECSKALLNFRIPDSDFKKTLERISAPKIGNTAVNGSAKFHVIGLLPDDTLTVRSGPGVSFPKVISVPNGTVVFVTGLGKMNGSTEWLPIDFGNSSGWVVSKYLQHAE